MRGAALPERSIHGAINVCLLAVVAVVAIDVDVVGFVVVDVVAGAFVPAVLLAIAAVATAIKNIGHSYARNR